MSHPLVQLLGAEGVQQLFGTARRLSEAHSNGGFLCNRIKDASNYVPHPRGTEIRSLLNSHLCYLTDTMAGTLGEDGCLTRTYCMWLHADWPDASDSDIKAGRLLWLDQIEQWVLGYQPDLPFPPPPLPPELP